MYLKHATIDTVTQRWCLRADLNRQHPRTGPGDSTSWPTQASILVPRAGFEPARLAAPTPQSGVSAVPPSGQDHGSYGVATPALVVSAAMIDHHQ